MTRGGGEAEGPRRSGSELDDAIHEAMVALASAASHEAARVVLAAMRLLEEREWCGRECPLSAPERAVARRRRPGRHPGPSRSSGRPG
jgi:hypothetical protein